MTEQESLDDLARAPRLNTPLRADLHRLVRIRAAEEGISIKDVLDDVVGAGIEARDELMGRKKEKSKAAKRNQPS